MSASLGSRETVWHGSDTTMPMLLHITHSVRFFFVTSKLIAPARLGPKDRAQSARWCLKLGLRHVLPLAQNHGETRIFFVGLSE